MRTQDFWMIYGEGCSAPTVKHDSEEIAKAEARRLARAVPGTVFYVLKAVGAATKQDIIYREIGKGDDFEMPF